MVLLAVSVTLSCALVTRPLPETLPFLDRGARRGLIAYTGTDGNIYTFDPESEQATAITQDANLRPGPEEVGRLYQYPTWAPDGRNLAFLGFAGSPQMEPLASLYTASADGSERVEAFRSEALFPFYLSWSPNSKFVTFLSNAPQGLGLALHLTSKEGGDSQVIGMGQPYYWDWSPDSQAIFAHTGGAAADNPSARMVLFELEGEIQTTELALKPGSFQAPAWSPGGEELVLAAERAGGGTELVLAGREGNVIRVLAALESPVAFAWSPDGENLAYTISTEGSLPGLFNNLLLLDPAQPEGSTQVTREIVVGFFWSPDSRKIAYFVPDLVDDPEGTSGSYQTISQDGNRPGVELQIYDLASGESRQIAFFEPTTAFLQILPFFDQYQRSGTIWSPDSRHLVLSTVDDDRNPKIVVVSVEGGEPQPVADGDLAFWSWK